MNAKLQALVTGIALLLATQAGLAAGQDQADTSGTVNDQTLTAEIDAVLNEYEALWDKQDPAQLIALWDQNDPEPFYLAEEQPEWRIGWDQLKDYWSPAGPSVTESIRMRFDGVRARWLADDLAFAKFWIRFDTKMSVMPGPFGTDARASAIFRKTDAGWRLITWAESPGSPLLYVQRLYKQHRQEGESSPIPYLSVLYERHTRDDFAAFMQTHKKPGKKK
ncbi:MAG: nuclear transport factor 2 family protein [Gammaproteobacteria bacterium]|nr:nuclear transport factor 2 family protein [Gammaproteobacteria bacterium]